MSVYLHLRCKRTGKEVSREINPLQEAFRRNPLGEIADWIALRGNPQHNTELELISYSTRHRCV